MFCPKCGTENQEGVKFCKNCGTRINSATRDTPIQQTSREPVTEQERKHEKIKLFIIDIIGVLILIFGVLSKSFIIVLIGGVVIIFGMSLRKKMEGGI